MQFEFALTDYNMLLVRAFMTIVQTLVYCLIDLVNVVSVCYYT
jgi:hypothetical protein